MSDAVNGDAMGDSAQRGDQAIMQKNRLIRANAKRSPSRSACVCCAGWAEISALSRDKLTKELWHVCGYIFTE